MTSKLGRQIPQKTQSRLRMQQTKKAERKSLQREK